MKKMCRQNRMSDHGGEMPSSGAIDRQRCSRAAEWESILYDYAEGLTDKETAAAAQEHIAECAYCRAALGEIRRMASALQASVPEPRSDLHMRIMDAIGTDDDGDGIVITETVDLRTGHVLSDPSRKCGMNEVMRILGGIAAAVVLIVGLVYLLPFLKINSGSSTSSGVQEIIGELQNGTDGLFSDGVFVGEPKETAAETEGNSFGVIPGNQSSATADTAVQQYAVTVDVSGTDRTEVLRVLAPLATSDENAASITETEHGILVSPLSVYQAAAALLDAADITVTVFEAQDASADRTACDAFYIRIREP